MVDVYAKMVAKRRRLRQFQNFFKEMDSSGVAGFAPEHVIKINTDPFKNAIEPEDKGSEPTK